MRALLRSPWVRLFLVSWVIWGALAWFWANSSGWYAEGVTEAFWLLGVLLPPAVALGIWWIARAVAPTASDTARR